MSDLINIYYLYDPRDDDIRYVGKTNNDITKRLHSHIREAKCSESNTHKLAWIRKLLKESVSPKIKLIETVSSDSWEEREKYWIVEYRNCGYSLTNMTDGGDGCVNQIVTDEVIEKRRKTQKERFASGKIVPWNKGKVGLDSEETKRKRIESRKKNGKPWISEKGRKMKSERMKGELNPMYKHIPWNKGKTGVYSKETLKLMSEAKKNNN